MIEILFWYQRVTSSRDSQIKTHYPLLSTGSTQKNIQKLLIGMLSINTNKQNYSHTSEYASENTEEEKKILFISERLIFHSYDRTFREII